jgi:hypothetical protein
MNAHTPFRLEAPVVTDLSRLDLSDAENVKNCGHQLRRCLTPGDFELWAREWGDKLVLAAEFYATHDSDAFVSADEVKEIEQDCERGKKTVDDLKTAMERAEMALDRLSEDFDLSEKLAARVEGIVSALENARGEA